MHAYLGIDIGGTKIDSGIVSDNGEILTHRKVDTPRQTGGQAILKAAIQLAGSLISEFQPERILSIGIGSGGQIDSNKGIVVAATNVLPGFVGLEIGSTFYKEFKLPIHVDNDVNALAAGECRFGAAKGYSTVVFLALGTGVGGALLLNGKIHHGAHWAGGEFGHILLHMETNSRKDLGGHEGTLEAYVSGHGLETTYRELTPNANDSLTGLEIAKLAIEKHDKNALKAIEVTGRYLGLGLVTLVNALDPDLIIIGGGLATLSEVLLSPARSVLSQRALGGPAKCKVQATSLGEHASVIGAASLAMPEN